MEESGGGAANGGGLQSVRVPSALETVGGRQRFEVELRPGETTIVSWKKLVKDASREIKPVSVPEPLPVVVHSAIEARLAPVSGPPVVNEAEDAPPASRFSAVIEKIERLYMGKNSSDEEDLNDVPDDDEYDTEDSFIDDAELDEYFQVDNSAIKHDGFFVNRGKLERTTNEPVVPPNEQPKKRRRKDMTKGSSGNEDGNAPNKQAKIAKKLAKMSGSTIIGNNAMSLPHVVALPSVHRKENMKLKNQIERSAKKNFLEYKTTSNPSPSRLSNGGNTVEEKDNDKHKSKTNKIHESKLKDSAGVGLFSDHSNQKSSENNLVWESRSQPGKLMNNADDMDPMSQRREKSSARDKSVVSASDSKNSMQTASTQKSGVQRKEGSGVKQRISLLDKAIRELEKMVAESRPQSMEVSDPNNPSQAVKKRMPPEIKQKLAKVARLAQVSHGSITNELLSRLMNIVGHLVQLRTLKRHLKAMVKMGVAAKQVKDARFQQIHKEIEEMVKARVPFLKSKAIEQQVGSADDFQDASSEAKVHKIIDDEVLEDRLCNLYDVFVEGLDEDATPQCRKLYIELAELWPKGFMDYRGIKQAIIKAKNRKKVVNNRHATEEKQRAKKSAQAKANESMQLETTIATTTSTSIQDKSVTGSGSQTVIPTAARIPTTASATISNGPNPDRPKQDKSAKTITTNINDARTSSDVPVKKKKRKPESDLAGAAHAHARPEKLTAVQGDEKIKPHKQVAGPGNHKSNNLQAMVSANAVTAQIPPAQPSSENLN
jgi:ubinuclein